MAVCKFDYALVHESYNPLFNEAGDILNEIEAAVSPPFNPAKENVFRVFAGGLDQTKVVILGQDPYPDPAAATGRCFEVGYLKSFSEPFRQVSLKNILRLIYSAYTGEDPYTPFSRVRELIKCGRFGIFPPDRLFEYWDTQGVMLLNTYLTCSTGKPKSHRDIWTSFAKMAIEYISGARSDLFWFVWGIEAAAFLPYIKGGNIYVSRHPMMCSKKYDDDFLKNRCFFETMEIINWTGAKKCL